MTPAPPCSRRPGRRRFDRVRLRGGGIPGYSHAFGGYAGSHAQFIRVPHAGVNCFTVPDGVSDQQALFLSDAVPTGSMDADVCEIEPGDTVAVWGCGAVGLMAQRSARLMGPERGIAALHLHSDRGSALREAAQAVRKAGTLSFVGVYGGRRTLP